MTRRALVIAIALIITSVIFSGMISIPGAIDGEPTRRFPSPPRNFTAQSQNNQIFLKWDDPLDNGDTPRIGFALYRGQDLSDIEPIKTDFGPYVFSYTDKSLINGRVYYYQLSAINEEGVGDRCEVISTKPVGKASVPRNITSNYESRRIDFEWLAPLDDGGDEIIGYYVMRGPNQDANDVVTKIGNVLTYSDTSVSNGVAYYYRFKAFSSYTNGTVSDYLQITPRGKPVAPGDLIVEPMDRKVHLNWTYPSDDGGSTVMGYNIYRGFSEGSMDLYRYVSSQTEYLDTNITNGRTYHYSVAAKNSEGVGDRTEVIAVSPIGVPDSPLNLTVDPGDTMAILNWRAPADDGGSEILGYNIYRTVKGETMKLVEDAGLVLEYTDENLTNGNIYYYQVRAYNDQGVGFPSQTIDVRPDFSPSAPENFRLTELDGYLKLMWALPPMLLDYPLLEFRLYRGETEVDLALLTSLAPTTSIYEDMDVEIGVEYHYVLSGVSKIGEGQDSSIISGRPYTQPAVVQNIVTTSSNKKVTLTWEPPIFLGGRDIVNYKIFRGENRDAMSVIDIISGTLLIYNDTNVVNGVTYYYSIMAINEKSDGDLSGPVEAEPLGPPDPPRNLIISVVGETILLEWEQPRSNGGRTITGYIILRGPSQLNLSLHANVGFTQNYTDTDIERGELYYYAIKGVNEIGEGKQSNVATGKVAEKTVDQDEKTSYTPYLIGGILVLVIALILIAVVVIMAKKKKKVEDEEGPVLEESDREREHRLVMERRQQMKEFTNVALSTDEAHAHDHDEHELSYDDLYGSTPTLEEVEAAEQRSSTSEESPFRETPDYQPPLEDIPPSPQPAPAEEAPDESVSSGELNPEYIPPQA